MGGVTKMKTIAAIALLATSITAQADILTYISIRDEIGRPTKFSKYVNSLEECRNIIRVFGEGYEEANVKNSVFYGACIDKLTKKFLFEVGDIK